MRELRKAGVLDRRWSSTWRFSSHGRVTCELRADPDGEGVRLACGDYGVHVQVERLPLPYGGARPWLLCPSCGRRCGVMYLHGSFACRTCHRLVYPSTREQADSRLASRLQRIMARLEASWRDDPRFVAKPRGMRWATFERLSREAQATEQARVGAILGSGARWLQRMQARQ